MSVVLDHPPRDTERFATSPAADDGSEEAFSLLRLQIPDHTQREVTMQALFLLVVGTAFGIITGYLASQTLWAQEVPAAEKTPATLSADLMTQRQILVHPQNANIPGFGKVSIAWILTTFPDGAGEVKVCVHPLDRVPNIPVCTAAQPL
jgi:hypothetical protein